MRSILKIMRFDFLTAKPNGLAACCAVLAACFALCLFFSPAIAAFAVLGAIVLVIPLQSAAEKSGFHKLYGILPVERKSISRGRFLYLFLVFFLTELLECAAAGISITLKLHRLLPDQNGAMMMKIRTAFADVSGTFLTIIFLFAALCLIFSYMEMMTQIFGRENEMKTILFTVSVISVLGVIFAILQEHDLIPVVTLPQLPHTASGVMLLGAAIHAVTLGLCILFGEITAAKLAVREL